MNFRHRLFAGILLALVVGTAFAKEMVCYPLQCDANGCWVICFEQG